MAAATSTLLRLLTTTGRTPPTEVISWRRALPIAGASALATGSAAGAGKVLADHLTAEPVPAAPAVAGR